MKSCYDSLLLLSRLSTHAARAMLPALCCPCGALEPHRQADMKAAQKMQEGNAPWQVLRAGWAGYGLCRLFGYQEKQSHHGIHSFCTTLASITVGLGKADLGKADLGTRVTAQSLLNNATTVMIMVPTVQKM